MASMKDYLEKAMLRLGSRGAMPGGVIEYPKDTTSFVAPCDGWAAFGIESKDENGWLSIRTSIGLNSVAQAPSGHNPEIFTPCYAGETVRFSKASGSIVNRIWFLKSFGGGLKSLIYKLFPEVRHAYA